MSTQERFEQTEVITAGMWGGFVSRWKQRKKVCVAGTILRFQKKIIMVTFVCACVQNKLLVKHM